MYPAASWEAMQEALGVSKSSLLNRAQRLGLSRHKESRQVERVCEKCGKAFTCAASRLKYGPAKFCSEACKHAAWREDDAGMRAGSSYKMCHTCGKAFRVNPASTQRFCSQACAVAWRDNPDRPGRVSRKHKRQTLVCKWCGKEFEKLPCQIKGGRGRFCSPNCQGAHTVSLRPQAAVSQLEKDFCALLRLHDLHFETQYKFENFVLDIAFPALKLAVEVDGDYWHSLPNIQEKDARKDAALEAAGWRVLHVPEWQIRQEPQIAIDSVIYEVR
jgi:very-short-patch-repair endonuclease